MTSRVFNLPGLASIALLVALTGCSKKDGKGKTETASKSAAVKATKPKFEAPKNVLMYTGTDSPEKTLGSLYEIAKAVTPLTPDPRPMLPQLIAGYFRLGNPMGIDIKKPLRFVLFDPQGLGRDPSALVIGMAKKIPVEQIVGPIERKQNDRNNQWSYLKRKSSKFPVFVNTIDGHMVLTRHADTFPKNKEFIVTMLKRPMAGAGALFGQIENAMTLFKPQIDQMLKTFKAQIQRTPQAAQSADMVNAILDSVRSFFSDVKLVEVRLNLQADGILIETISSAKDGTSLSKTWSQLKSQPHDLLDKVPANASGVVSMGWTGPAYEKLAKSAFKMLNGLTGPSTAGVTPEQTDYLKLLNGKAAMFFFTPKSGRGLVGSGIVGIQDQMKAAAAFEKLAVQTQNNPKMKTLMEQSGLKTETVKSLKTVGNLPTFESKTTATRPGTMNPAALMGMDRLSIAFGKSTVMMAFGRKAHSILEQQNASALTGFKTSKGGAKALKNAAKNMLLFGYLSPINVARQARLGGMNPFAKTLADIESDSGIALSVGHDQGQLLTVLDIPTQLLVDAFKVFERVKGSF